MVGAADQWRWPGLQRFHHRRHTVAALGAEGEVSEHIFKAVLFRPVTEADQRLYMLIIIPAYNGLVAGGYHDLLFPWHSGAFLGLVVDDLRLVVHHVPGVYPVTENRSHRLIAPAGSVLVGSTVPKKAGVAVLRLVHAWFYDAPLCEDFADLNKAVSRERQTVDFFNHGGGFFIYDQVIPVGRVNPIAIGRLPADIIALVCSLTLGRFHLAGENIPSNRFLTKRLKCTPWFEN